MLIIYQIANLVACNVVGNACPRKNRACCLGALSTPQRKSRILDQLNRFPHTSHRFNNPPEDHTPAKFPNVCIFFLTYSTLHYRVDELSFNNFISNLNHRDPTSGACTLDSIVGPMNIAHHMSNDMNSTCCDSNVPS